MKKLYTKRSRMKIKKLSVVKEGNSYIVGNKEEALYVR